MKKIFFLAATLIAAISVNAIGFDYTVDKIYSLDINTVFTNLVNCTIVQTADPAEGDVTGKNSINLTTGGQEASFSMGGVVWSYTNSTDGTTIAKQYGNYVQPNGKDRIITIPAKAGDEVSITVVDAVPADGITVTGIEESFAGFEASTATTFTATGNVVITTGSAKPKFSAILVGGETGIFSPKATVKSQKVIENGQLYIIRDGEKFNVLGAKVSK